MQAAGKSFTTEGTENTGKKLREQELCHLPPVTDNLLLPQHQFNPDNLLRCREQQRLRRRFGGDAVKFGIMLAERLGNFHFRTGEQTD
jgi:hypothetical protein